MHFAVARWGIFFHNLALAEVCALLLLVLILLHIHTNRYVNCLVVLTDCTEIQYCILDMHDI